MLDDFSSKEYANALDVDALNAFVKKHWKNKIEAPQEFLKEMVLWSLAEYSQVNKERTNVKTDFNDLFGNMISGLSPEE